MAKEEIENRKLWQKSSERSKGRIGVIGATGYTGMELIRLLTDHPDISLEVVTSRSNAGVRFSKLYPSFEGIFDDELQSMEVLQDIELDLVFLALPHRVSMDFVKEYGLKNFRIIDLSGDFRLKSHKSV
jgi:N-acetyl-gamma-glutamyl-phosphate reductase